jgi:hypothetical protein
MAGGDKRKPLEPADFASNQLKLLELERLAEVAESSDAIATFSHSQLQARGIALLNLSIGSIRTGLGGKLYVPSSNKINRFQVGGIRKGCLYGRGSSSSCNSNG